MEAIKKLCLLVIFCSVVVNVLGENDVNANSGPKEEARFLDLDGILSSAMSGMDVKVNSYVNQGSSVVQKVTQSSHGTLGGQTITKTEITELTGNNPLGFRFKRGLLDDVIYNVENHADAVKHKVAGAMADGINLAHSGVNKVKDAVHHRLRD